jgi:hypothetical protein
VNALEDRLRDAYRALADTVDPAGIPGLTVSTGPRLTVSRRMRFVSALAAAAAVTLVAVIATIPEGASPGHHAKAVRTPATAGASLPAFLLVDKGPSLAVYSTRTGLGVATLTAPDGQQFEDVASGGTTRTFLAATGLAGSACHAFFYRSELSASGKPSSLTLLRSVPDSQPTAVAAPPGGGSYAYSTVHCATAPPNGAIGISGPAGNRTWAYDLGDDYAASLAASAGDHMLAFSLSAPSGNMLLNTSSRSRTVGGASRILRSMPASVTLAISPGGQTLYACAKGTLAAYSTATGAQIRVLRKWPGQGVTCQVSLDPTGRFLLAAVTSDLGQPATLIGFDLHTGASVTLRVHPVLHFQGTQLAW